MNYFIYLHGPQLLHWDGFGISELTWTILVISVGVLISLLMLALRKDIAYSLVVIWAFLGIYIKRTSILYINNTVATTSLIAILIIAIGAIVIIGYQLLKKKPGNTIRPGCNKNRIAGKSGSLLTKSIC